MEMSIMLPVYAQVAAARSMIEKGMTLDEIQQKYPYLSAGLSDIRSNICTKN